MTLAWSGQGRAAAQKEASGKKLWGRAFWRSALVPGWGQWKNGMGWRGAGVLAAYGASLAWFILMTGAEKASYEQYDAATSPKMAVEAWQNHSNQKTLYIVSQYVLGTVYLGQLGEAVYSAPRQALPASGLNSPRLMLASLEWRF